MKLIPFSTNKYTSDTHFMVDDDDYDRVRQYKWRAKTPRYNENSKIYATRHARRSEMDLGSPTAVDLHRFILNIHMRYAHEFEQVDHINGNALDNRKENLRICSRHTNLRNRRDNTKIGMGLWGATYNKGLKTKEKKWQANFHFKGKTYMVGYFKTEIEAHDAARLRYEEVTGKEITTIHRG
jgi:HNH endonuclease